MPSITQALFRNLRALVPQKYYVHFNNAFEAILWMLPTKTRIRIYYYKSFQSFPNFRNPKTFNEKCQWLKLAGDERLAVCTDKVAAKGYVAERIGNDLLIPTLFHGRKLPPLAKRDWPFPYVIKANHGAGFNIFVRSKNDLDWPNIEAKVNEWLSRKYGYLGGELYYTRIKPQVLVEPFVSEDGDLPPVYKIFVFNGVPKYISIQAALRNIRVGRPFYDIFWNRQSFRLGDPPDSTEYQRPVCLAQMLAAASKIGRNFGFVSVDFYAIAGRPYFSEMEFTPDCGLNKFYPTEMDLALGDLWPIPVIQHAGYMGIRF